MKVKRTKRGFGIIEFKDHNSEECSLQMSSLAGIECIWLGCSETIVKGFFPSTENPWREFKKEQLTKILSRIEGQHCEYVISTNRMHLTRKQVAKLLPHLQNFVDTGLLEADNAR